MNLFENLIKDKQVDNYRYRLYLEKRRMSVIVDEYDTNCKSTCSNNLSAAWLERQKIYGWGVCFQEVESE